MTNQRILVACLGLSLLALPMMAPVHAGPSGGALLGPFAGSIEAGDSHQHTYDNNPLDLTCVHLAVWYRVSLTVSAGVTADLTVNGVTVTASAAASAAASAGVSFQKGVCASFPILVDGVAGEGAYEVTVTQYTHQLS